MGRWPAQPATHASASRRHRKELPRRLQRLAHAAVVTSDGSHPMVKVDPAATGIPRLSSGRATTVPFTAVLIGPERTTTDNATAPSTCAAPPTSQVTTSPNLALQAGGRLVEA